MGYYDLEIEKEIENTINFPAPCGNAERKRKKEKEL